MFTPYNINFFNKSQYSSTVRRNFKELNFNLVFNAFLIITFLNIIYSYNNLKFTPASIVFLCLILLFFYNFICNIKEFRILKFIINNKEISINFFNSSNVENINIVSASTTNNNFVPRIDEVFSNSASAIEDIINPSLKKKAKQKLKHIEKTQELKGNFIEKLEECLNFVSITDYGVVTGSYCKNKYCPTCSKIKELKNKYLIEKLLNHFSSKTILFATFTVPSVVVKNEEEAKEHREKVTKAFSKMVRSFKNITGYIKKVETTFKEETKQLNIHIHSFLLVTNYANEYIKKEEWKKKWQHYTKDKKAKEIKIILISKEEKSLKKLSSYISKYDLDKMKISDEISNLFLEAEEKKRDLTFSGEFKEVKKIIEVEMKKNRKQYAKSIGDKLVNLYWSKEQSTYIN